VQTLEAQREEYLLRGQNGVETCLTLSEEYASLFAKRKLMERGKIKALLQMFNEHGIRYAIIGGVALAHHARPRMTQDLDLLVAWEDIEQLRQLLSDYYQRGTAVVYLFDVEGTKLDILPAKLRYQLAALDDAVDATIDDIPTRVVGVRDLILLKLFAIAERLELEARRQDEADVTSLLERNAERISKSDINYIAERMLELCFTREQAQKCRQILAWLNETLDLLGMADRKYPL